MYDSIVGTYLESPKTAIGQKQPPKPPPPGKTATAPGKIFTEPAKPSVPFREAPVRKAEPPEPPHRK